MKNLKKIFLLVLLVLGVGGPLLNAMERRGMMQVDAGAASSGWAQGGASGCEACSATWGEAWADTSGWEQGASSGGEAWRADTSGGEGEAVKLGLPGEGDNLSLSFYLLGTLLKRIGENVCLEERGYSCWRLFFVAELGHLLRRFDIPLPCVRPPLLQTTAVDRYLSEGEGRLLVIALAIASEIDRTWLGFKALLGHASVQFVCKMLVEVDTAYALLAR